VASPKAEPAAQPAAQPAASKQSKQSVADKEAKFMAALQRMVGPDVELTDAKVREVIGTLTPEQRAELVSEGQDLREELVTGDHEDAVQLFRKEVNDRAEKSDLPVEKDGEHLAKKVQSFMRESNEALPHIYIFEAVVSAPYLVKLALAEAREDAAKAEPADLTAIEAECVRLKLPGWRDAEAEGRPPFVRRNLLLLAYALNMTRMESVKLQQSSEAALGELAAKVRRMLDMLLKFCLQNRWVKAALTVTECQAMVLNGLWDPKEDECRELMRTRMSQSGLKLPKLSVAAVCPDTRTGQKVHLKVEVQRAHCYSPEEMAEHKKPLNDGEETREGWWVICESIRAGSLLKNASQQKVDHKDIVHNTLVGRAAMGAGLDAPTMTCELEFEAPETPGEYKIMVHVKSSGCVGVDVRRKVSFQVLPSRTPTANSSGSSGASSGDPVETGAQEDDVPPLDEVPELA